MTPLGLAPYAGFALTAFTAVGLLFFVALTLWIFRLLYSRVPQRVLLADQEHLNRTIAVLVTLAIYPDLVVYAWQVLVSLVTTVATLVQQLSTYSVPGSCFLPDIDSSCTADVANNVSKFLSDAATRLLTAVRLNDMPVGSFIWFLLISVVLYHLISLARRELTFTRLMQAGPFLQRGIPVLLRQRAAFAVLVIVAFYLGLSALLAIPLFNEKTSVLQLSAESLSKILDNNSLPDDAFSKQYPVTLPNPQIDSAGTLSDSVAWRKQTWDIEVSRREDMLNDAKRFWTLLRDGVLTEQPSLKTRALDNFTAGLALSNSSRVTARHYYDITIWHQAATANLRRSLDNCRAAIGELNSVAEETLRQFKLTVLSASDNSFGAALDGYNRTPLSNLYLKSNGAARACQPTDSIDLYIPDRPQIGSMLGPVGAWTGWLLNTNQMPVVIIVGLVGFSLLGATVSRAVRIGDQSPSTNLSLDDLLIVIAAGTTAAVVVFLAAYGGLALLSTTGGDPNPYIVFATCLMGAIYSEDVWTWGRRRLLTNQLNKPADSAPTPVKDVKSGR